MFYLSTESTFSHAISLLYLSFFLSISISLLLPLCPPSLFLPLSLPSFLSVLSVLSLTLSLPRSLTHPPPRMFQAEEAKRRAEQHDADDNANEADADRPEMEQPELVTGGKMRDYQLAGVAWMKVNIAVALQSWLLQGCLA